MLLNSEVAFAYQAQPMLRAATLLLGAPQDKANILQEMVGQKLPQETLQALEEFKLQLGANG